MGLMQRAYETYCAMEQNYAGQYDSKQKEPLAPVGHLLTSAEIEITLDDQGNFKSASAVGKEEPKTIIPATEKSAGRVGDNTCAHPLCDQLRYLAPYSGGKYEAYVAQLRTWESSPYSHPKLQAILHYVEKGTILQDLAAYDLIKLDDRGIPIKEKAVVRWIVLSGKDTDTPECWKDTTLHRAFIQFYQAQQTGVRQMCMVTGEAAIPASQHPKGIASIIRNTGNAKLISAKDSCGFTYHGRFTEDWQATTVSYEASQKAHSALRWVIANQGVAYGNRVFVCWNPQGRPIPKVDSPFFKDVQAPKKAPSEYREALRDTLKGWKTQLPEDASAVVAAFDAATSGRLALTYFSELQASDFLQRLHDWDNICCWWNGPFGIQAPSLVQIVNCAFGVPRTQNKQTKLEPDDRILRQQVQRLIACRVDKAMLPLDILQAIVKKASNLQLLSAGQREMLLFTACAVIRKYHFDRNGEEWDMALEPDKRDVSYQYGRLLAVLEKIERDTYKNDEEREPNAMRLQSVYAQRPRYGARTIWEQVKKAYLPRHKPGDRGSYERLMGEIMEMLSSFPEQEQTKPLSDTYLLGYYLQKNDLYRTKSQKTEE